MRRRVAMGFFANLLTELALRISASVVLLMGTVPSGQDSPEMAHDWKDTAIAGPVGGRPLGLSGGS